MELREDKIELLKQIVDSSGQNMYSLLNQEELFVVSDSLDERATEKFQFLHSILFRNGSTVWQNLTDYTLRFQTVALQAEFEHQLDQVTHIPAMTENSTKLLLDKIRQKYTDVQNKLQHQSSTQTSTLTVTEVPNGNTGFENTSETEVLASDARAIKFMVGVVIIGLILLFVYKFLDSPFNSKNSASSNRVRTTTQSTTIGTEANTRPSIQSTSPATTERTTEPTSEPTSAYVYYILPQSSSNLLGEYDIAHLSIAELELARNEIYARHGRLFRTDYIQEYFNQQSWYHGTIAPDDFNQETLFNDIEKVNVEFLLNYEKQKRAQ